MNNFGNNLKKIRKQKNIKADEVAKQLGVSPAGYSRYENNHNGMDFDKLMQLCDILNTTPNDLFDYHYPKNSNNNILQDVKRKYHLSDNDINVITTFINMSDEKRNAIHNLINCFLNSSIPHIIEMETETEIEERSNNIKRTG